VKISTDTFAVVNGTVKGKVGTALGPNDNTATIQLYGDAVTIDTNDVRSWFNSLPAGVNVSGVFDPVSRTILLTFTGTPRVGSQAAFDITIPGVRHVLNNAKFEIEGMYDLIVGAGEGGAVGKTEIHGTYVEIHPFQDQINAVPAVADSGYNFRGWTIVGLDFTTSQENPLKAFPMPAETVIVFATFAKPGADTVRDDPDAPVNPVDPVNPGGTDPCAGGCDSAGAGMIGALILPLVFLRSKRGKR
jgi:hypothetical protein